MSDRHSITLNYVSPESSAGEIWAHIEQIKPPAILQYASLRDVYRLWLAAATGRSARAIRPEGCPVEFIGSKTHIYLGFYVWPSSDLLAYAVTAAQGELSSPAPIRKLREKSYLVDGDTLKLPYRMEDAEITWQTPCFLTDNTRLDADPEWISTGTEIRFSEPVFGVCRVKGKACGMSYVCEMIFDKEVIEDDAVPAAEDISNTKYMVYDVNGYRSILPAPVNLNSNKIENLQNTITTSWIDDGRTVTEQLRLEIPDCVQSVLSFCPGEYMTTEIICREVTDKVVYYNGCTGEFLFTDEKPGMSFCSKIDLQDRPSWLPESFYDRL